MIAIQLLYQGGRLQIAIKGGVARSGAGSRLGDLLTRDPHDGVAGVAGDNIAGEAEEILQLHGRHGGAVTAESQRNDEPLLAEVLEHAVDLFVEEADVGRLVPRAQPQTGLTVAALGNKVGLVNGKTICNTVIHNVLELAATLAAGLVADRGGDLCGCLPVGVAQPEEGRAVGVLIVALVFHGGNEAVLGQIRFLPRFGCGNLNFGYDSFVYGFTQRSRKGATL